MAQKNTAHYKAGPVCKTGAKILYAWAMDAPPLKLPEGEDLILYINTVSAKKMRIDI